MVEGSAERPLISYTDGSRYEGIIVAAVAADL
jgi:hypothetical protein